jgi:CRP-like cAMP-binding protein
MLQREYVHAGAFLLRQGVQGSNAYMIESGRLEVSMKCPDGGEIVLAELGPGAFIGEMAALFGGKRCASARACEDCVLVTISGQDLRESARMLEGMDNYITELISDRIRDIQMKLLQRTTDKWLKKMEKPN